MTSSVSEEIIRSNVSTICEQISIHCSRAARPVEDVQLVAVTKYAELSWMRCLQSVLPAVRFGENRPQQLAERRAQFDGAEWHLIGQLQRNKVRLAVANADVIHSVDSVRLLKRVNDVAGELSQSIRVLLQVNVSGEDSKSGFAPDGLRRVWEEILEQSWFIEISGLMTMAPEVEDPEDARPFFRELAMLREELRGFVGNPAIHLQELSMGMSGDFGVAVEEGATLVRVGSALFEGLS